MHYVLKPLEQVKKSKRYSSKLTSGMEGTHRLDEEKMITEVDRTSFISRFMGKSDWGEFVMLYEIWDKENDELLVIDSYSRKGKDNKFLRSEKNPYKIEGVPFEMLIFNPDPDTPFGIPDSRVWESPTQAINFINSMHYNHIKRFQRKYVVTKGKLAEGGIDKLLNPEDGTVVEINGLPSDIAALEDAPMSSDAYNLREILKNELISITGVTEQRRGVVERAKTATEASIMDQQARVRDSDRLYLVSKFVERSAKKILQLDRQFLDGEYLSFVVGPEEGALWNASSEQILKAEVDIKVRVGSSAYMSKEVKTKQLLDFMNLTAQLADPATGMPIVNIQEIIKRIADSMDIDDYESLLNPMMSMAPPGMQGTPTQGGPGMQDPALRTGSPNLGNLLSGVQNLGVRRNTGVPLNE
jgi:hypothetical protein